MIYKKNSNILLEADELLDPWLLAKTPTPTGLETCVTAVFHKAWKQHLSRETVDMAQHPRPSAFPLQLSHSEEPGVGNRLPAVMIREEAIGFQGEASPLYKTRQSCICFRGKSRQLQAPFSLTFVQKYPRVTYSLEASWQSLEFYPKGLASSKGQRLFLDLQAQARDGRFRTTGGFPRTALVLLLSTCLPLSWRCKSCPCVPLPLKHVMGKSIS